MFVSVMKNKFVRWVIYAVLGVFSLYNGIACAAVLYKAGGQPYLLSGAERFDFMGYYYIMAALHGVICAFLVVILVLLVRGRRKRKGRDGREIYAGRVDKGKGL